MKKLKTQAKSWKNSSQNSKKTQKLATPVELNWRKIVQKKAWLKWLQIELSRNYFSAPHQSRWAVACMWILAMFWGVTLYRTWLCNICSGIFEGQRRGSRHSLSVIPGSLSPLFPISARQCVQGRCLSSFFQSKPWYASGFSAWSGEVANTNS